MTQKLPPTDLGEPPDGRRLPALGAWALVPGAEDYYNGNWRRVTARGGASGATVWAQGAVLMVTGSAGLRDGCAGMLTREFEVGGQLSKN